MTEKKRVRTRMPPILKKELEARVGMKVSTRKAKKKVLTPQEWTFVMELVSNDGKLTMKEAAMKAGWKEAGATAAARRMTDPVKCPHIVLQIQEYREQLRAKYDTTYERHMRDMQDIRDGALAAGNYSAAVAAEYRRGQALGTIYVARSEVRHGLIDSMSKEEVMLKLEQIRQLYGVGGAPKMLIDVTPERLATPAEPEVLITEQMADGEKLRREIAHANPAGNEARMRMAARDADRARRARLSGSDTGPAVGAVGTEGNKPWEKDKN
jgi:hypothetical protein